MKRNEYNGVYAILAITACFSEGEKLPSAWSSTKRLLEIQSIAFFVQAIASYFDQTIAFWSNQLPYAVYGSLSFDIMY